MLFARLAAEGAGRPVDQHGFADGPWTPESLADAISSLEGNEKGIELRAVQVWFQDNDNGIGNDNIKWLARIFGCDDPEETSRWQAEIRASKDRLTAERRQRHGKSSPPNTDERTTGKTIGGDATETELGTNPPISARIPDDSASGIDLALRTETMFSGPNSLSMPITIWGGLGVLWFIAFSLGVHSVTYSPEAGIDKQVGLMWSPGWSIGEPVSLPIYLILISALARNWNNKDRSTLIASKGAQSIQTWPQKVRSFGASFWAILLICFGLIFLIQWIGVYFIPLQNNSADVVMIDWMLLALVRPEVISPTNAIWVSFLGFLYSGLIYWFLFSGSLLLYMHSSDYAEICKYQAPGSEVQDVDQSFQLGMKIIECVFRCTVLGILVALSIKINAAYLVTDADSISGWLLNDAAIALSASSERWSWINGSPSPFYTSFLLLFLLCFVFGACLMLVKSGIDKNSVFSQEARHAKGVWFRMCFVLVVLSAGYILIGQFYGFSILLSFSVIIALTSLFWQVEQSNNKIPDESLSR